MKKKAALASVKAFLPQKPEIADIISACDLYPAQSSWRKWTDHQGNFIQIHSNKKVVSFVSNPLSQEDRIVTDVYFKSHPRKVFSISDWAFISFGRDNNNTFSICFIWLLGLDKRLRLLSYANGVWIKNSPPLISGIDTLRSIIRHKDVNGFNRVDILNIKGPTSAKITKSWVTEWPPSDDLMMEMFNTSEELTVEIQEIICQKTSTRKYEKN